MCLHPQCLEERLVLRRPSIQKFFEEQNLLWSTHSSITCLFLVSAWILPAELCTCVSLVSTAVYYSTVWTYTLVYPPACAWSFEVFPLVLRTKNAAWNILACFSGDRYKSFQNIPSEFTLIYTPVEIHCLALRCLYFPSLCLDCGTNTKCCTLSMSIFSLKKSKFVLKPKSRPRAAWTGPGRSGKAVLQHLCHFNPQGCSRVDQDDGFHSFQSSWIWFSQAVQCPCSLSAKIAIWRTTTCFAIILPLGVFSCPHQFCSLSWPLWGVNRSPHSALPLTVCSQKCIPSTSFAVSSVQFMTERVRLARDGGPAGKSSELWTFRRYVHSFPGTMLRWLFSADPTFVL